MLGEPLNEALVVRHQRAKKSMNIPAFLDDVIAWRHGATIPTRGFRPARGRSLRDAWTMWRSGIRDSQIMKCDSRNAIKDTAAWEFSHPTVSSLGFTIPASAARIDFSPRSMSRICVVAALPLAIHLSGNIIGGSDATSNDWLCWVYGPGLGSLQFQLCSKRRRQ
jgi:hypothetical protein